MVQRKAFSYIWNQTWGKNFHIKAERTSEKVQKQLLSSYLSLSAMVQNFLSCGSGRPQLNMVDSQGLSNKRREKEGRVRDAMSLSKE